MIKGLVVGTGVVLLSLSGALTGGCADYPTNIHGPRSDMYPGLPPTLIMRNESASAVRVFPWMGHIDIMDPSGASEFRRRHPFDVVPGCTERTALGTAWVHAEDAIVRIGILELDENGHAPADYEAQTRWFEFEQPHPFDLRITGEAGALEYESIGEGGLVELAGSVGTG